MKLGWDPMGGVVGELGRGLLGQGGKAGFSSAGTRRAAKASAQRVTSGANGVRTS